MFALQAVGTKGYTGNFIKKNFLTVSVIKYCNKLFKEVI